MSTINKPARSLPITYLTGAIVMRPIFQSSAYLKNYKCFGSEWCGFDRILPINLLIGRNNSGKSTLLESLEYLTRDEFNPKISKHPTNGSPEVMFSTVITEKLLKTQFHPNTSTSGIPSNTDWDYAKPYVNQEIEIRVAADSTRKISWIDTPAAREDHPMDKLQAAGKYLAHMATQANNPFKDFTFRHMAAERSIGPEALNDELQTVGPNGANATSLIVAFLTDVRFQSKLVEETLLNELNEILSPDIEFDRITCQKVASSRWEVYLVDPNKGSIPLSESGSGLQSILLMLVFLHLVPVAENTHPGKYIYAFEELENNIHPAVFRSIIAYLKEFATEYDIPIFLTTHSSVGIDQLHTDRNAQILHVRNDGGESTVTNVTGYLENKGIVDDLDIRASDILQANCVIWVEGPSDRIYLNKWLDLWADGRLEEGRHYQCVFYGGRLLSHLSLEHGANGASSVRILNVNRNAFVLMDSDRKRRRQNINGTKRRIRNAVEGVGGKSWVTRGREIENYIPKSAVERAIGITINRKISEYDDLFETIEKIDKARGRKYRNQKPLFAERVCQELRLEELKNVLDWGSKMSDLAKFIERCN